MKRLAALAITFLCLALVLTGCDSLFPADSATTAAYVHTAPPVTTTPPPVTTTPSPTVIVTPEPTPSIAPSPTTTPPPTEPPVTEDNFQFISYGGAATDNAAISREYQWDFGRAEWTWDMRIPEATYDYFKALPRAPTNNYSIYVTNPLDDAMIDSLAEEITEKAAASGYDAYDTVSLAVAFVQSLPYTTDNVSTGYDEYPRYPVETLVDDGGDCEDTSILAAALLQAMGYDVVLLVFDETADAGGHCAVGVYGGDGITGTYWTYNGRKYFYLESTGENWDIGQIPDEYRDRQARVYPMVPVPILFHTWESEAGGDDLTLVVNVENLGTADAANVYVYAGFDAGNDRLWNPVSSPVFTVAMGETKTVTLYLKVPYNEHTRICVQIVYDGYAADESNSKWFDT